MIELGDCIVFNSASGKKEEGIIVTTYGKKDLTVRLSRPEPFTSGHESIVRRQIVGRMDPKKEAKLRALEAIKDD